MPTMGVGGCCETVRVRGSGIISMGAELMLCELGVRKIRLMTNNPKKVVGLEGYGLNIVEQLPIVPEANPHNKQYLQTKKLKMGHTL